MLDLADGTLFRSRFARKMLSPDAFEASEFSVDDAALFFNFEEQCRPAGLAADKHAELVLNALVAVRFLKPLMPKSWYFSAHYQQWRPADGTLVTVAVSESGEPATMLVVEAGDNAALCLLAQPQMMIGNKEMQLGDAIKIMFDRLRPLENADRLTWACAG